MTSSNIAPPLTLRTSPSDYGTFYQIHSFKLSNIGLILARENNQKIHFMLSLLSMGGCRQKLENVVKNFLTVISNGTGFKLFSFNQVIDKVNC